jgi:N-acetylated-alpha-linked acidic dipeptidase
VGVPSLEVGFQTPGGEYHTSYDNTEMMERFLDPRLTWVIRRRPA